MLVDFGEKRCRKDHLLSVSLIMTTAFAICAIELPADLGDVLEPDHFRVVEVYFCRDTANEALDRLNIAHADTRFCYVLQQTHVVDNENELLNITLDLEFRLVLVDAGDRRRDVILLVRKVLDLPLALARQMVDGGEAVVANGSRFEIQEIQRRFDGLGAVTRVEAW